jgi:myosin heavy subunit
MHGFQKLSLSTLSFDKLKPDLFTLMHSPCSVSYSIAGFKTKNQDKFNDDILELVGALWGERKDKGGKTILTKFSKQMDDLMTELESSEVHFMRCIKPNEKKRPDYPDENCILTQVRYLGVLQTIFIRKNTFPHRRTYSDFRKVYCIAFKSLYKEGNDR